MSDEVRTDVDTTVHWGVRYATDSICWCPTQGGRRDPDPLTEDEARRLYRRDRGIYKRRPIELVTRTEVVTTVTSPRSVPTSVEVVTTVTSPWAAVEP